MPILSDGMKATMMSIMAGIGKSVAFFMICLTEKPIEGSSMLDDLFEGSKHNRHSNRYGQDHRHAGYGDERNVHYNPLLDLAKKLLRNKAILAGIVLTILMIGAAGIWLIVTLFPYLGQVISIADKQGIKGIIETITPFLQKLWEGAGQ